MNDLESVFDVVGLIFKPRAASSPQGSLSPSLDQPEHPVRQYLAKGASE